MLNKIEVTSVCTWYVLFYSFWKKELVFTADLKKKKKKRLVKSFNLKTYFVEGANEK